MPAFAMSTSEAAPLLASPSAEYPATQTESKCIDDSCLHKNYAEPHSTSNMVTRVAKTRRHITMYPSKALAMKPLSLVVSKPRKPRSHVAMSPRGIATNQPRRVVLYACTTTYDCILAFCSDVQFCLVTKNVCAGYCWVQERCNPLR